MLTPLRSPSPAPARTPETDAERRARQLDMLREMAELSMAVARDAAAKAISPIPPRPTRPTPA